MFWFGRVPPFPSVLFLGYASLPDNLVIMYYSVGCGGGRLAGIEATTAVTASAGMIDQKRFCQWRRKLLGVAATVY